MKSWSKIVNLKNMSIRTKLLVAPAVLVLALILITTMAVYGLNQQTQAMDVVDEIILNQITLIDRFSLLSEQVQSDVYRIAVLHFMELPDEEIQPVQASLQAGVNELKIIYGEISTGWELDETEKSILTNMKLPLDEFLIQAQQAADVVTDTPAFGVLMVRSSTQSFNKFRDLLMELLNYQRVKISNTHIENVNKTAALKTMSVVFLVLIAVTGIITNLFISTRLIARPIHETTLMMKRLAENDLSIELRGLDRKDEIGAMTGAVEVFRNNAIEKARLDKELQDSQERLLLAQKVAHIGNWELDLASNTVWASEEAFRIYGLERPSPYLSLEQVQKIPVPEDRPRLNVALDSLIQQQIPYNIEFQILHSNEETPRVIHSQANLIYDESGEPVRVVGVIQDITARKIAEAELQQSEEKFSKAFQTSPYAITITNLQDGKFIDVNEAFSSITGYTYEEALASSSILMNLWVNEEDRNQVAAELRADRAVSGQEFQFLRKDGEIITGLFSAQTIFLNQTPCILSSINDITERKRDEELIRLKTEELDRFFTSNLDLFCIADTDGNFRRLNPEWENTLGYSLSDLEGHRFLDFVHPDDLDATLKTLSLLSSQKEVLNFTNRYRCKDDSYRWIEWRSYPAGDLIYASARDITQRKQAEETLAKITDELKRSNDDLENFAYVASHDLQEPLRMITSYMQLLERRFSDKLDDQALEFIAFAVDGAKRMKTLISDLLEYSRVSTRGNILDKTDCESILENIINNLQIAIQESRAEITHDPLPVVRGDKTQLQQLFQNLINNAIKYHRDNEEPKIHIAVERKESHWVFSVKDNGIGIDPHQFEHIFVIFQRLNTKNEYPGTGIGLAISKRIVERHGGRIWIESQPGEGSTFFFTLPLNGESYDAN